jgi:hypothetical protein
MSATFERITWQRAEALAERRLDRRRRYAFNGVELCELGRWSEICSGCAIYGCIDVGCGCHECGYTGRRRQACWVPVQIAQDTRKEAA